MLTSRAINCVNSLHKESLKHLMRKIYFTTCYAVNRTELPLVRDLSSNVKEEAVVPLRSVKGKSDTNPVRKFVDCMEVEVLGGNGGDGNISFLSLFAVEFAGPDGGDGGHGGHVIFRASDRVRDLSHLKKKIQARFGTPGGNKNMHGKDAEHLYVDVPTGTLIRETVPAST